MSSSEITHYMSRHIGKAFKGCFPRDDLPSKLVNGYYVVNLDTKYSNGTHWVGMKVGKKEIIYFDSFGFVCPTEIVRRKASRVILYSTHEIQNSKSVACGFYVIYFLRELYKGRDRLDILLDFDNNGSIENDDKLKSLLVPGK